jgi:crotonobetainyl-CoA:carnitine CoA-transferase CaiB-like acyl-CoA transferase
VGPDRRRRGRAGGRGTDPAVNRCRLLAACLPDPRAERAHLAGLLPAGTVPIDAPVRALDAAECAVLAWARSGLMELTGFPSGPALSPAAPVVTRAHAVASAIADLTSKQGRALELDVHEILTGRAAEAGWHRQGTVSANGTCRLLSAADGWLAINLARPVDVRSLPAVLGRDLANDAWAELRAEAGSRPATDVAAAAQLVGIPAAVLGADAPAPFRLAKLGLGATPRAAPRLVLDLSAMWAGPLCASILGRTGWRVLKVEDSRRPDGARFGPPRFYERLHAGQPTVRLDFGSTAGRAELLRLADRADVIVESSRPRALRGLGLVAEDWLGAAPGRIWVSVTGYGRDDPQQRVAFGDDAAVAGGLVAYPQDGTPVFCGDAIADPLTGLYAGLAALAAHAAGGGTLVDVAMAGVSADIARPVAGPLLPHVIRHTGDGWTVSHGATTEPVQAP